MESEQGNIFLFCSPADDLVPDPVIAYNWNKAFLFMHTFSLFYEHKIFTKPCLCE
jgi:hypothetical protein